MFDVLCISDCCCDLIFKGLARVPAPGTEEYCQNLYMKAGGGANTPMGLAKLGCATAVSYTHLDVYKRQARGCSGWTKIWQMR